jgi:hypothetical protein
VNEHSEKEAFMQSCVIDGQVRDFNLSGADSLASMLNSLNGDLLENGRFIASLRVNGREVADIGEESGQRLEGIGPIEITTESPLSVARNIIAEGEIFIEGLQDYLVRTAGHYSSGNECAGRYFDEAVQGLQWFVQMIGFIEETLQLDFDQLSINGKQVVEYVLGLNSIFQDIVNSQENFDPVLLADLLEYDLVPHLEEWKGIFTLFEGELVSKAC